MRVRKTTPRQAPNTLALVDSSQSIYDNIIHTLNLWCLCVRVCVEVWRCDLCVCALYLWHHTHLVWGSISMRTTNANSDQLIEAANHKHLPASCCRIMCWKSDVRSRGRQSNLVLDARATCIINLFPLHRLMSSSLRCVRSFYYMTFRNVSFRGTTCLVCTPQRRPHVTTIPSGGHRRQFHFVKDTLSTLYIYITISIFALILA